MAEQLGKRIITELFSARHDDMPKNHTIKAPVEYAYKRIRVQKKKKKTDMTL